MDGRANVSPALDRRFQVRASMARGVNTGSLVDAPGQSNSLIVNLRQR